MGFLSSCNLVKFFLYCIVLETYFLSKMFMYKFDVYQFRYLLILNFMYRMKHVTNRFLLKKNLLTLFLMTHV